MARRGGSWGVDGVSFGTMRARGRVGGLDLVVVDEVPPLVVLVVAVFGLVFVLFVVVVGLFGRIGYVAACQNLDS
jgi:hypothetical protein